ncbi:MAG: hypothetical protein LAO20_09045 [Acidobacteriia bacterium]|nr:hypothetical protein [Terriglobia bacterium]
MRLSQTFLLTLCLAAPFVVAAGQTAEFKKEDCVAQNDAGWPFPWSAMKYSISNRAVLLYNGKPTVIHKQLLTFAKEISIPVPGCGTSHLLRTNSIGRIDFEGHVFAYLISGVAVNRDERGHERATGAIKFAMWYDEEGDGRFKKVIWTPPLPPAIPAWARGSKGPKVSDDHR